MCGLEGGCLGASGFGLAARTGGVGTGAGVSRSGGVPSGGRRNGTGVVDDGLHLGWPGALGILAYELTCSARTRRNVGPSTPGP